MSKEQTGFPSSSMPPQEAEEFMALLLASQSTQHDCPYCAYFKKVIYKD